MVENDNENTTHEDICEMVKVVLEWQMKIVDWIFLQKDKIGCVCETHQYNPYHFQCKEQNCENEGFTWIPVPHKNLEKKENCWKY